MGRLAQLCRARLLLAAACIARCGKGQSGVAHFAAQTCALQQYLLAGSTVSSYCVYALAGWTELPNRRQHAGSTILAARHVALP